MNLKDIWDIIKDEIPVEYHISALIILSLVFALVWLKQNKKTINRKSELQSSVNVNVTGNGNYVTTGNQTINIIIVLSVASVVWVYNPIIQFGFGSLIPHYAYNRVVKITELSFGQKQEAIEDYNKAISLNPDSAKAYYNRGVAKYELGQKKEAIIDFNKAIRLKPDLAEAYCNRGSAKYAFGQNEEAIDDYNKAIEIKPDFGEAYYNRGVAKYELGQNEEAIDDFNQAIILNPSLSQLFKNHGGIFGLSYKLH